MLRSAGFSQWVLPLALIQLVATGLSILSVSTGCEELPEASPSPIPGSLEAWEDLEWGGWLDYQDSLVHLHLWTTFELFSFRDGLFCGRYRGWWFSEGSYLEVYDGTSWIVIVQDDPSDGMSGGTEGRLYGTVNADFSMDGWLDLTTTGEVAAVDSSAIPELDPVTQYLEGALWSSGALSLDTKPLSVGELIGYATREQVEPMSADTLSTLPTSEIIDLAPYSLQVLAPITNEEVEALYCAWCKEPGDDETPTPVPPDPSTAQGGSR